jgi:hypothetical protein
MKRKAKKNARRVSRARVRGGSVCRKEAERDRLSVIAVAEERGKLYQQEAQRKADADYYMNLVFLAAVGGIMFGSAVTFAMVAWG